VKVSALLLAQDEAINIARCIDSLQGIEDIVVVDSGSTDRTVELARSLGARVVYRKFDNFANQRNFGLEEGDLKNDWVLHLDADEVLTEDFRTQLEKLDPPAAIDGYYVPSRTILGDRWLKHAGMYPSYQARLGHRDRFRFVQVGHGQREAVPPERMGTFDVPYDHYCFSHGMVRWLEKHVRYARDEATLLASRHEESESGQREGPGQARTARRRVAKQWAGRIPLALRPVARFLYIYFWRLGFLDGFAGFRYAFMLSVYEGMIAVIGWGLRDRSSRFNG